MANIKGLLKSIGDRLPAVPAQAEEIVKALLTEEEYKEVSEGFFVYQNGEVKEVSGNPSRGEYRFVALGNKIAGEPTFRKGFWFFTPENEEITEETPVLALRKSGHLYFNTNDDTEAVQKAAEEFILNNLDKE